jgi:hypothetical protein
MAQLDPSGRMERKMLWPFSSKQDRSSWYGGSINGGVPPNRLFIRENPTKMDVLGNTHISWSSLFLVVTALILCCAKLWSVKLTPFYESSLPFHWGARSSCLILVHRDTAPKQYIFSGMWIMCSCFFLNIDPFTKPIPTQMLHAISYYIWAIVGAKNWWEFQHYGDTYGNGTGMVLVWNGNVW